jgi:hypothetical protein
MNIDTLDPIILDVHRRMHPAILGELRKPHDRGIRHALEFVGAPHMDDEHAVAFFGVLSGARESMLAHAIDAALLEPARRRLVLDSMALARRVDAAVHLPLSLMPGHDPFAQVDPYALAEYAQTRPPGFGDAGGGGGGSSGSTAVRRIPWALGASTTIPASSNSTNADPALYTNGTSYPFVVTHVTVSQDLEPLLLNPSYRLKIVPASGIQWMKEKVDASAICDYLGPAAIPTTSRFQACRWQFAAPYAQRLAQSAYIAVMNPHTAQGIRVAVGLYGVKRNQLGSPRIFWATTALAASAGETPLDSDKFKNDGDFVCDLQALMVSGGIGGWGAANPTAPRLLVRMNEDREFLGNPQGTLATAINTVEGNLGPYWQLVTPQRIPNGSALTVEFEETTGAQVIANVGFVGYLEVPA